MYPRLPRWLKDVQRFSCGLATGLALHLLLLGMWAVGAIILAALLMMHWLYRRGRAKRKLHACDGCAEYDESTVCSGYAFQATHVRRYEDAAESYLAKLNPVPPLN